MWKNGDGRHDPGRALPHFPHGFLQELPGATGLLRGPEADAGGGAEVVLERRPHRGQREGGDGAGADAGCTGAARVAAAGAGRTVHRGQTQFHVAPPLVLLFSVTPNDDGQTADFVKRLINQNNFIFLAYQRDF